MKKVLFLAGVALFASCRKELSYPGIHTKVAIVADGQFPDHVVQTPQTHVRIGSFLASNADTKDVSLGRIELSFAGTALLDSVRNIELNISGSASYTQTFSTLSHTLTTPIVVHCPANGLLFIDIIADIGKTQGSLQSGIRIFDESGTPLTSTFILGQTITLTR